MFKKTEDTAETYKLMGYMTLDELAEKVLPNQRRARRHEVVKDFMQYPMKKMDQLLVLTGLSVRPADWSFKRLYHPDTQVLFVAYLNWRDFGQRMPADEYVSLFVDVYTGDERVNVFVPKDIHSKRKAAVKRLKSVLAG